MRRRRRGFSPEPHVGSSGKLPARVLAEVPRCRGAGRAPRPLGEAGPCALAGVRPLLRREPCIEKLTSVEQRVFLFQP